MRTVRIAPPFSALRGTEFVYGWPMAWRAALGARTPDQGLLIAKRLYDRIGGHHDVAASEDEFLRRLGRRRLVTLASAAVRDNS